jgi:PadR family transcriptional regulator, regulatory protein PadR
MALNELSPREELILCTLKNKRLYGLQIPKAIAQASNGNRDLKIGSLYPLLAILENKGLVSSQWGDERPPRKGGARRRYYQLTQEGIASLDSAESFRSNLLAWRPN